MLIINNQTKTLLMNRNIKVKFKRAIIIDFTFDNPLYNEIFDIQQSFLEGDFIYVLGTFNKGYKNIFPHEGDIVEYTFTKGLLQENLYE